MSFIKANKQIEVYAYDTKKIPDKEGYLGYWLANKVIKPARTLLPGEIFSRAFIKKFTDNYGNTWLKTQPYTTGVTSYIKVSGDDDYSLTANVLTEEEQKKAKEIDKDSFGNKVLKAATGTVKAVAALFIGGWLIKELFFSKKKK